MTEPYRPAAAYTGPAPLPVALLTEADCYGFDLRPNAPLVALQPYRPGADYGELTEAYKAQWEGWEDDAADDLQDGTEVFTYYLAACPMWAYSYGDSAKRVPT